MTRVVYVNGRYLPYAEAGVHVEDRGFQFADAIYEVCEVNGGRLVDETRHMDRLERSLGELRIPLPMSRRALGLILREVIRRNRVETGLVYLQVTRGTAPRDFPFPAAGATSPTVVCLARRVDGTKREARAEGGIAVKTMPDIRWGRCDIKTVMLLPAVLAKEAAAADGAQEAWLVDSDGFITEGASSNAWIVDKAGTLITRPTGNAILPGVTRRSLLDVLSRENIPLVERPFSVDEAISAREAFITSASGTVMPVVRINGVSIGNGYPGDLTRRLRSKFHQAVEFSR
ncbi:D-amino-acid transaminase [Hyphomicrobium sp. DMF-1]|jgi:D-alanine transaminase|uniref:D-amino-acid transaminase n=1 Tax=Hyphomicrobium TaxID=81 RepID=UPI00047DDECA|nr:MULTISPECIES: D-amino-acid transaminase [Hyphomicrobium]WBT36402.1 D-amino-acid transaminase [Hyphomicrobium sp. DMF-1]HML44172.1 D-amino-acid transaminase [Hyphomicrobium zavarzinii]